MGDAKIAALTIRQKFHVRVGPMTPDGRLMNPCNQLWPVFDSAAGVDLIVIGDTLLHKPSAKDQGYQDRNTGCPYHQAAPGFTGRDDHQPDHGKAEANHAAAEDISTAPERKQDPADQQERAFDRG